MISSICLLQSAKCLLVCDGKSFSVYGESPIANSIREHSERKSGLFADLLKQASDDFDPVCYWYESSMNFADEEPPVDYNEKTLRVAKKRLAELK